MSTFPPPPQTRVTAKSKARQPQIHKSGPLIFNTSLSHAEFLDQLATTVPCRRVALPESQLRWKFEKPINGDEKPLSGEVGYRAMVEAARERKKDRVLVIAMPPPQEPKESVVRTSPNQAVALLRALYSHGTLVKTTKCLRRNLSMHMTR